MNPKLYCSAKSAGLCSVRPLATFAGMVTRMDEHAGRVLARLKELGIDDDTIVFFTSDNGPLRGIQRDLYKGGIRVPMIVRRPGKVRAGKTSEQVWAHWDFLPTAAANAGAKAPAGIDGLSMLQALLGKKQRGHEILYWEFHERGFEQAVRMGDWKAVRHAPTNPIELYNLKDDLREQNNIAARHPEVVKKIENHLLSARAESALWPIKTKN